VSFFRPDGSPITAEAGRSFTPKTVDNDAAWTVSQSFDSPADEAFFGLGQHQADEWNYKGRNEELYQYNTKISIPFIVNLYTPFLYAVSSTWSVIIPFSSLVTVAFEAFVALSFIESV